MIGDDDFIDAVEKQMHDLNPIIDPKIFKSYEKLAEHYAKVTGFSTAVPTTDVNGNSAGSIPSVDDGMTDDAPVASPKAQKPAAPKPVGKTAKAKNAPVEPAADASDDDDYFSKLAAQSASDD